MQGSTMGGLGSNSLTVQGLGFRNIGVGLITTSILRVPYHK